MAHNIGKPPLELPEVDGCQFRLASLALAHLLPQPQLLMACPYAPLALRRCGGAVVRGVDRREISDALHRGIPRVDEDRAATTGAERPVRIGPASA